MKLTFSKMHGLGNDFMVIETISQSISLTQEQIQQLAHRHTGVGFDQLLLISPPINTDHDFIYRIFNADGSEVEQCGNGARCVARFIYEKKLSEKKELKLFTRAGIVRVEKISRTEFCVDMGAPEFSPNKIPFITQEKQKIYSITADTKHFQAVVLSMGNPHMVILDSLSDAEIKELGPKLMMHPAFPKGVNVSFLKILDSKNINLRVFERGVGETQACGTGACAAVVAGRVLGDLDETVNVFLRGGRLTVSWEGNSSPVKQTGSATFVYDATLNRDFLVSS